MNKQRIVVGEPLPFSVFDADHKLLLAQGSIVESAWTRDRLLAMGAYTKDADESDNRRSTDAPLEELNVSPLLTLSRDYADLARRARFGVKIAPAETGESYLCWVMGVSQKNRCLVLTAPARLDKSLVPVIKGQKWVCRLFNATTVFRFYGVVLKTAFEPFPYLYIALPPSIERRTVRTVPRALVNLHATLALPEEHRAAIVDLSVSGARIGIEKQLKLAVGDTLKMTTAIQLLDKDEQLELQVRIVACYGEADPQHPDVVFYGLRFESPEEANVLRLHAYVQQQLATELDGLGQVLMLDLPAGSNR